MKDDFLDYKEEFTKIKLFLIGVCVACTTLSIYITISCFNEAEENRKEIFIADANNTLLVALSNDMNLNRPNEAKACLKKLHYFLFNVTPSATHINSSIERAKAISDQSVSQYIEKLKEEGWYNSMIAKSISTEFICDSISIVESDRDEYCFKAYLYGKTSTISQDKIEFRSIATSCYLSNMERTVNEPNGFKINLWAIDKNVLLKEINRKELQKESKHNTEEKENNNTNEKKNGTE